MSEKNTKICNECGHMFDAGNTNIDECPKCVGDSFFFPNAYIVRGREVRLKLDKREE